MLLDYMYMVWYLSLDILCESRSTSTSISLKERSPQFDRASWCMLIGQMMLTMQERLGENSATVLLASSHTPGEAVVFSIPTPG
jgi:hypothetical protein